MDEIEELERAISHFHEAIGVCDRVIEALEEENMLACICDDVRCSDLVVESTIEGLMAHAKGQRDVLDHRIKVWEKTLKALKEQSKLEEFGEG